MQMNLLFEGAVRAQYKQQVSTNVDAVGRQPLGGKKEIAVERDGNAFILMLSDEMKQLSL